MSRHGVTVISIGTELLLGETVNTNFAYLGRELNGCGLEVEREICIPDTPELMRAVFAQALAEAEAVITIGGLGPTADDLTKEIAAEVLGLPLTIDPDVLGVIRAKYLQHQVAPLHRACERQAQMPTGSAAVTNDWGTAPGVWWSDAERVLIMLPGPPRELRPMFSQNVLPQLQKRLKPREKRLTLTIFGTPESIVEQRTMVALAGLPQVVPSYCTRWGSCLVRLSTTPADAAYLQQGADAIREAFGRDARIGEVTIVEALAELLRERGWQVATAESCTGGGIGWSITELAGVSDIFAGGVITYTNALKQQLLGVQDATLAAHGAVSEEVAREMAAGAALRLGTAAAISVTGIAGPGGGSEQKPVGTVWIGTCVNGDVQATHHLYPYDRQGVRERTVSSALNQLRRHLLANESTTTAP